MLQEENTDLVSALIYDPNLDMFFFTVTHDDERPQYQLLTTRVRPGEHPIPALRRALREKFEFTLRENQYYYLQTIVTATRHEHTRYLVLSPQRSIETGVVGGDLHWTYAHQISRIPSLADEAQSALALFQSKHGGEAERRNLSHMLAISARSR